MKKHVLTLIGVFALMNGALAENIRLLLPENIFAVPKNEANLYFDNVVLTPNINNYVFDVECAKGRQDKTRWRFTPTIKDVGNFKFSLKILNGDNKVIDEKSSELCVVPPDAGNGKKISILIVGDSLTDASYYPNELSKLFKTSGNPDVKFIGSHAGCGRKPDKNNVAHEGRGGWTWKAYCTRWKTQEKKEDYRSKSPFLFLKEGKPQLDFKKYLDKYNDGKVPDFITVFLGCNDNFRAKDENIDKSIENMFAYADTLIAEFKKVSPKIQIGLLLTVPPVASQDAFGANYKCGQTRWQYRRNQHKVVERMLEKYKNSAKDNIFLVPAYINLDCANNFPKKNEKLNSRNNKKTMRDCNGVHPAKTGYFQIADTLYCWLKHRLSIMDKEIKK